MSDAELAADLARRAGALLLELRDELGFAHPDRLRAEGDRRSHEFLAAELARARPDDTVLSEEGEDDRSRLTANRVWIVDPLDGTNEYGDEGRTDWAVHVALWTRPPHPAECDVLPASGRPESGTTSHSAGGSWFGLTAGAVALPARGIVLWTEGASATEGGPGSGLPELPQPADPRLPELPQPADPRLPELPQPADPRLPELPQPAEPPRIAVSRSRAPEFVQALADRIGARLTPIGSAGMKAMSVLLGEADAYVHRGRMKEWDSAAPAAVAKAAGLHVSRLDGSPLTYNTPERLTPDLLICLPSLAQQLLDAVDALLDLEH